MWRETQQIIGVDTTNETSVSMSEIYRYELILFAGFFFPLISKLDLEQEGKLKARYCILQTSESDVAERNK